MFNFFNQYTSQLRNFIHQRGEKKPPLQTLRSENNNEILSPELLTPSTSTKNGQDTARSSSSSKLPFREINFKNKLKAIKERLQKVIPFS